MSAYKLIEVVKTTERENQSIYDNDNRNGAIAKMHNDFGVAVKANDTLAVYCLVVDNTNGTMVDLCNWTKAAEEGAESVDVRIRPRVYTHNDYADDNISSYENEQLAIGNYHTKIASSMNKTECNFAVTIRLNGNGSYAEYDLFNRGVE